MKTLKNGSRFLVLAAAFALASCGGGGGDSTPTAAPTSFWTTNSFQYVNGGFSAQSTSSTAGRPLTIVAVSTATLAGGDTTNGAYSGSSITFAFVGSGAGTYTAVKDDATLVNSDPAVRLIRVQVVVGTGTNTGSTQYTATDGQVAVTQDSAGKYHFSSVGSLPTFKTFDIQGGVAGAPATMALLVRDAF